MNKFLLLIIFLIAKWSYLPLNKRKSKYYWKINFDNRIPLVPIFIVPYIGYYFYIIASILLIWNTKYINSFFVTYIITSFLAGLFWYFIPNGVKRPQVNKAGILSAITSFVHSYDGDTNGFPSAHVYATLICSFYLSLVFPAFLFLIWSINLLICISTVLVKQHYILDLFGGILFFLIGLYISNLVLIF